MILPVMRVFTASGSRDTKTAFRQEGQDFLKEPEREVPAWCLLAGIGYEIPWGIKRHILPL